MKRDTSKDIPIGKMALLLIDMQNDFVSWTPYASAIVPNLKKVLKACRGNRIPVIHVIRHYSEDASDVELPRVENFLKRPFVVGGTPGAEVVPQLSPTEGEPVIIKKRWSAFFRTGLKVLLEELGLDTIVVGGIFTPNCVRTTVFDAVALDLNVHVLTDGTASEDPDVQDANILDMVNIGVGTLTCGELIRSIELRGKV
jgi:nicotinamidase-related amidase